MNKLYALFLIIILSVAFFVRFYRVTETPPSLSWDETAVGYNAWSVANFGKDEWSRILPIYFKSFEDDKHPVHIYITSLFIKVLGPSDFSVRFPSVIFGVLNVLIVFLIGRLMFNKTIGLIAAFILALSPYAIHFSRFNHELNFTIFFFLLGLFLFYQAIKRNIYFLPLSFLAFGIDLLSYHSAKVVIPPIILLLIVLHLKNLLQVKIILVLSFLIIGFFIMLTALNPPLLGLARSKQTSFSEDRIEKTFIYKFTKNDLLGRLGVAIEQYPLHFNKEYLFTKGSTNPRLSNQAGGLFFPIDGLFLLFGLIWILWKRSKEGLLIVAVGLLAPIPSALTSEAPHPARAMYMVGSWHIISALGAYFLLGLFKKNIFKILIIFCISLFIIFSSYKNFSKYLTEYNDRYAIEWQYGMKDIVEFVKTKPQYGWIYTTDVRSQPYIFYLFYLLTPPDKFQSTVEYNQTSQRSSNLVTFFDTYHFGDWDFVESSPRPGVIYVLSPSQYDGLRYKADFKIKKKILYPNGSDAYFIVGVD